MHGQNHFKFIEILLFVRCILMSSVKTVCYCGSYLGQIFWMRMVLENIKRETDAWKSLFRNVKKLDIGKKL